MKDRSKVTVALVAIVLGGALVGGVEAGNAQIASAEYFSLALEPGNYIHYVGSDPDATLLIDDLTFAADLDVSDLDSRSTLFSFANVDINEEDSFSTGSIGAGDFFAHNWEKLTQRFSDAKGKYYRAAVSDVNTSEVGPVFDTFTHTVYACAVSVTRDESGSYERFVSTEPQMFAVLQHSASSATHAIAEAVAIASWATPTSESRHYQTPHIVQNDRVLFTSSGYANAVLYVKGRVILEAADVPTVNSDVGVDQN